MESIGIVHEQGTILRQVPQKIQVIRDGATLVLDRYTGPVYDTEHGKIQCGDYIAFGVHVTAQWVALNPTQWESVA